MLIFIISMVISIITFSSIITENEDNSINIDIDFKNSKKFMVIVMSVILTVLSVLVKDYGITTIIIVQVITVMSVFDLRFKLVPDTLSVVVALIGVFILLTDINMYTILDHTISAVIVFLLFLGVALLTDGGFGGADIKLFTALGLVFGSKEIALIIVLTFLVGSVFVLGKYIITKDKEVKLVPYIALGTILTILFGDSIMDWYLNGGINNLLIAMFSWEVTNETLY